MTSFAVCRSRWRSISNIPGRNVKIKVNVYLLNKKPGDLLALGDKDYDTFRMWAEKKDTRNGAQICEFHVPPEPDKVSVESKKDAPAEDGKKDKKNKE